MGTTDPNDTPDTHGIQWRCMPYYGLSPDADYCAWMVELGERIPEVRLERIVYGDCVGPPRDGEDGQRT